MTKKQYMETYQTEKNLKDAHLYPYESSDERVNVKMLNARAALICSMVKKERWNINTIDRVVKNILTDVGFEIAKAEGGLI